MIVFSLKCPDDHQFESWFRSAAAFDALSDQGRLSCPLCGSGAVTKSLMAPAVRPGGTKADMTATDRTTARPPGESVADVATAIAALRREVEANSEYVGLNFAAEARRIHDGDAAARAIFGEARPDEARRLIADGIPVAPLPFVPRRKTN